MDEEYYESLFQEVRELKKRKADVLRKYDGIPPLETWAYKFFSGLGEVLRPSLEDLEREKQNLEDWLSEHD